MITLPATNGFTACGLVRFVDGEQTGTRGISRQLPGATDGGAAVPEPSDGRGL